MNKNAQELSDAQLDAISGGCYHKPDYCEPKPDYCKPKQDYCKPPKKDCYEDRWDRWCEKVQDYFERKYS